MIYENLWNAPNETIARTHLYAKERFAAPQIVGKQFAGEACFWLYEHGNMGLEVPLDNLKTYLVHDLYNVGVAPVDCMMRSLNVRVSCPWTNSGTSMYDTIEDKFAPLLTLGVISGFALTIHVVHEYWDRVNIHTLVTISSQIKAVFEEFIAHGAVVKIEFELKTAVQQRVLGGSYGSVCGRRLRFAGHTPRHSARPGVPRRLFIRGPTAESMLVADHEQWKSYLEA